MAGTLQEFKYLYTFVERVRHIDPGPGVNEEPCRQPKRVKRLSGIIMMPTLRSS